VPQKPYKTFVSRKEVIRMLRKMFSLGALVVVAVTFGVGNAMAAKPGNSAPSHAGATHGAGWTDGFSDGRD
jgi:hypothetical protein